MFGGCRPTPSNPTFADSGEAVRNSDDHDDAAPVPLGQRDPESGLLVLSPRRTLPTARAYVEELHKHPDGCTLVDYGGVLMQWEGNCYRQIEDGFVKHCLHPWLHRALRYEKLKSGALELVPFESNPTIVKAALDSLRSHVFLPASTISPSWLSDWTTERPPAVEILPCRSMSLHIPTGRILAPTPALFTVNALDFDYDPESPPPFLWHGFLKQLFGDDEESIGLLQEWVGYLLTGDTSQQKMLLIVGRKRSGKGTIDRVLRRLVGESNVVGPTTNSLAGNFGLQPLVGKSVAIVSDARFAGENIGTVVERLLCISGEDTLSIDRKYLGAVSMKLPTRFTFFTNEVPRFADASGALAGRFLLLRLTASFFGQEDPTLSDKLAAELPGILGWAIEGWKRLHARGRFVQPQSCAETLLDMEELSSPVAAFIRERCELGVGLRAQVADLYAAWKQWCDQDGRQHVTNKQTFGRDLAAAAPGVTRRRGTAQVSFYEGISLGRFSL